MTARAGFCADCGEDVWLKDGGGCIFNHNPASVRDARLVPLPQELDRFNWGAFFFPVLWPLVKGPIKWAGIVFGLGFLINVTSEFISPYWWPLSLMLGIGELALSIWFARNANRLLWEDRAWAVDVEPLLKSQRKWARVGIVLTVGTGALLLLFFIATWAQGPA
ncbi:MAG: hypothetical protein Q7W30_04485 [Coriobacteriia bacterium]|nr:hypothetical protein [Coriobacteriia bacterium]